MDEIFELILNYNLQISLLIVSIIVLRWLLKKVTKIHNVYWLWVLLPLVPLLSVVSTHIPDEHRAVVVEKISTVQTGLRPVFVNITPAPLLIYEFKPTTEIIIHQSKSIDTKQLFTCIWLLGCLFFIVRLLRQHCSLRAQLNSERVSLNTEFKKRYPIIGIEIAGFSPAVYGFFKPKIYFPRELYRQLNTDQRSLILEHEEQHIRQGHLWLNLAWDLVICLNWFNPLLYIARYLYRHDQEVLCDSLVLKNHDESRQKVYGHALLSTVSATHSVSLLCSWKMFDQLEERIMNIKSKYKKIKLVILSTVIVSVLSMTSLYSIASSDDMKLDVDVKRADGEIHVLDIARPHAEVKEALIVGEVVSSIGILSFSFDGEEEVVIKKGSTTYVAKRAEKFAIDNGQRRDLSNEELAEVQDMLEKKGRFQELYNKQQHYGEGTLSNIFGTDNVHPSHMTMNQAEKRFLVDKFEKLQKVYDDNVSSEVRRLLLNSAYAEDYTEGFINVALEDAKKSDNPDDPKVKAAIQSLVENTYQLQVQRIEALTKIEDLKKVYVKK